MPPLVRAFAPDVLVSQHGCDTHMHDPLAHLAITVDAQRRAHETLHDIIIIHTIFGMPIMTILFRNYYASVPLELFKAARVDGAGFWQIFFRIMIPMSLPITVVAIILQVTGIWNDFLFGVVFAGHAQLADDGAAQQLRGEEASTQFERATQELGIKIIHAHSPQAKGRIERAFATLQDRLVKELRLASISTLVDANRFLESHLPRFNAQFEREPREPEDLHRPLPKGFKFEEIFCLKTVRTILDGYLIRWKGKPLRHRGADTSDAGPAGHGDAPLRRPDDHPLRRPGPGLPGDRRTAEAHPGGARGQAEAAQVHTASDPPLEGLQRPVADDLPERP